MNTSYTQIYKDFDAIQCANYRKVVINAVMAVLDVNLLPQFKDKCEVLMRDRSKYKRLAERSRKIDAIIFRMLYPMVEPSDRNLVESVCKAAAMHDGMTNRLHA